MEETRLKDIQKKLTSDGFNTFFPGQHKGECTSSYIVVKDGGTMQLGTFSSIQYFYSIMLYVPSDQFSKLDPLMQQIKGSIKELSKQICLRPAYDWSEPFYDESVKAWMTYITYANIRKL